jgi:hypothetical protein
LYKKFSGDRERLFQPARKPGQSRGSVIAAAKVARSGVRHVAGTGSESDLLEGLSAKFDQESIL